MTQIGWPRSDDPEIFRKLNKFVGNNDKNIEGNIAYFINSMIGHKEIYSDTFMESYQPAVENICKILRYFHFFDEVNFENDVLNQA